MNIISSFIVNGIRALLVPILAAGCTSVIAAEAGKAANYCAVEIGSRGVKGRLFSFAMRVTDKDQPPFKTDYTRDINTNLVASMEGENFSKRGIEDATRAVETLLSEMRTKDPSCKAVVVGSSGIGRGKNRADLTSAVTSRTQILEMEYITAEQEAKYGFMGSVPTAEWDSSLFLDIGGGNTKISFMKGSEFRTHEIPFGSVSLTDRAAAGGADFWNATQAVIDSEIRPAFRRIASKEPRMLNYRTLYWIGGTAWATSTFIAPDKAARRFVPMNTDEIAEFRKSLEAKTWADSRPSILASGRAKRAFEKDSKSVQDIFTRDNLIAGHGIVKMIIEDSARKTPIIFARYGNWIFGYVQEKFSDEAWGKDSIEAHL